MTALPTQRLEAWRYTNLRPLAAMSFGEVPEADLPADLPELGLPRLVFVNGRFVAQASATLAFARPFAAVVETTDLPMAMINAENAHDGMTLEIPAGVDAGAVLVVSYANGGAVHLRHRVTLGAGAALTLIEIAKGDGLYWHDPVTEIVLGEGARLSHYRLQDESQEAFHLATICATVAADAAYESFSAVMGAKLSRAEFHVELNGAKAHTHVNAAQLLGRAQHGDFTTVIAHKAPEGTSRQTVKSVLSDSARGVFQGRIEVDRVAQKTDGYQMNQALLLSPTAEMDIKPELQIYADDVKCSHGATIGAVDEEQVFYLRSRGIPEDMARSMLIRAFLAEALEPVTHEAAHALFETAIETWWARK